jgi:hypothetical protein
LKLANLYEQVTTKIIAELETASCPARKILGGVLCRQRSDESALVGALSSTKTHSGGSAVNGATAGSYRKTVAQYGQLI